MHSIEWFLVISITALIVALYCLFALLSIRLRKKINTESTTSHDELGKLEQRIDQLQLRLISLQSDRSQSLPITRQLAELEERIDELDLRGGSGEVSYKLASRLVKRGIAVDELVKTCGMTRGEAELLHFMRRA
ncbi:MAG TPA: DUF2802 domain-containing protein [Gammaproteobacteria bacterium]|nr:DUF2802 domain-containing protein [Gammaproteobacteria bacterium]